MLALLFLTVAAVAQDGKEALVDPVLRGTSIVGAEGTVVARRGLVVAAPHEGFDSYTGALTLEFNAALPVAHVIAAGFRKRAKGRYVNVNRPTEKLVSDGKLGPEITSKRAAGVFGRYRAALHSAGASSPLSLLVELHGNSRYVRVEADDGSATRVALNVIECASTGFTAEQARAIVAAYDKVKGDGPALYFDCIPEHTSYRFAGVEQRFFFRASGSKRAGSLNESVTRHSLHLELPRSVRYDPKRRKVFVVALRSVIETAWEIARPH